MPQPEETTMDRLFSKVDALLKLVENLKAENTLLKKKIAEIQRHPKTNPDDSETNDKELSHLKKENKLLKEREKLIKNKVERLMVKLENIES
ncbi:MAG: hypothetical protein R3C26_23015 [Calditrichia bacterium]|nr:hypothetical protein [Calditrichota bacterium]MCB0269280.1 hypothetical protein [Calditrichota bacterium]